MSRSNHDVGGYRGRRTVTDILKIVAIILGVLVVLAVAGTVYLQRYMVYTDEGMKLELPPFLQMLRQGGGESPEGPTSVPAPGDLSIDIQPAGSLSEPQPPEGGDQSGMELEGFALQLSVDEVVNGTAAARLAEAGASALVLEVKDQTGQLAWLSAAEDAVKGQVNGTQAAADALRQWNAGEVYTIARVCCFRDDTAAYHINSQALHQSNGTWRDELGLRWFSPAQDRIQAYLAALCGELAGMGFDEIVLEQFSFPTRGNLDRILPGSDYDAAQFTTEMESFLIQVRQAVEPYGTKLSLRVEADTLAGTETVSGMTPELLDRFAFRIWTGREGALQWSASPDAALDRVVEIVEQAEEDSGMFQAVLPAPPVG